MQGADTIVLRLLSAVLILLSTGCGRSTRDREVVVYTSVDQVYSEPVFKEFGAGTGIKVRPVYDIEASKTTGLVSRLITEKRRPRADVFWSGEFAQTLLLRDQDILAPYDPPAAAELPVAYRDPGHYWTAFGGRARVWIVNTDLVPPAGYPESIDDLLASRFAGERIGIAYPLFGTSGTHAAALYAVMGPSRAAAFYRAARTRGVRVLDGNSAVRDRVVSGGLALGITDTDDGCQAIRVGAHVNLVFPDQGKSGSGVFVIPNTVALIAGASNPDEGRLLIDFLLSARVERTLVESGWCQFPLRSTGPRPACGDGRDAKRLDVPLERVYAQLQRAKQELTDIFVE
jgi:iron(III) transport system substrate-binding protein